MFIFHLVRDYSRSNYDIPNQYIIVAKSAARARKIAADDDGNEYISDDWLDTKFSSCTRLGIPFNEIERIVLIEVHEG